MIEIISMDCAEMTEDRYKKRNIEIQEIVKFGEIVYTNNPNRYNLLGIGTCIAVYIYSIDDQKYMIAHTVLPKFKDRNKEFDPEMPGKYVDVAIRLMIKRLQSEGIKREKLCAKIVGGGRIYNDLLNIGAKNINSAEKILKDEEIVITGRDVGGDCGRSILEFNKDGTIKIRKKGKQFYI